MLQRTFTTLALLLLLVIPTTCLAIQPGEKLKSFKAEDMNGNMIDMGNIIGTKPVMLVFWASWCPNCRTEAPKVNELVEKYSQQGMAFIGINIGYNDSPKRAEKFIKSNKMMYPTVFDASNAITQKYMVHGVPTILVADSKGIIQFRNYGVPEITEEQLKLLKGK